ncbi:MAG TPA: hypothetical protein VNN07_03190 [Candidatus Tectomicrobia bacterium]|nr:hypothetical protein [Candidatus Tectomicrobia bacterium]
MPTDRVADLLRNHRPRAFCDQCLAVMLVNRIADLLRDERPRAVCDQGLATQLGVAVDEVQRLRGRSPVSAASRVLQTCSRCRRTWS